MNEGMIEEMYAVTLEATGWTTDTFCAYTLEECIDYCKENNYKIDGEKGKIIRYLDEDGYMAEVLDEITLDDDYSPNCWGWL